MKWNNRKGNFSQKPQRENHAKNAERFKTVLREMSVFSVGSARETAFTQRPQRENHAKERKEGLDHATRNESTLCG